MAAGEEVAVRVAEAGQAVAGQAVAVELARVVELAPAAEGALPEARAERLEVGRAREPGLLAEWVVGRRAPAAVGQQPDPALAPG